MQFPSAMGKKLLILCTILLLTSNVSKAQGYAGKDFWLAFMDIDGCTPIPLIPNPLGLPTYWYDTTELYLSSPYAAKVTIEIQPYTGGDNGIDKHYLYTVTLTPNKTTYILLPVALMARFAYSDEVGPNGIHITSDTQIYVQAVNKYRKTKGSTAVLPSTSIPFATEYIISTNEATQQNNCNASMGWNPSTCSEFVIVGIAYKFNTITHKFIFCL